MSASLQPFSSIPVISELGKDVDLVLEYSSGGHTSSPDSLFKIKAMVAKLLSVSIVIHYSGLLGLLHAINSVSPHLTSSIGSVNLKEMMDNKTSFTIGKLI